MLAAMDGADDGAAARALRARMVPGTPPALLAHADRVAALAGRLARRHGADIARTLLAAQGHDLLRALPGAELLARAEARGLDPLPVERRRPVLLHGPLGALELRERFGVRDPLVLHAIRWHTTGHPAFGPEAWAVFVADKAEPAKLERRPELQRVLDLAADSLERAALACLDLRLGRPGRRAARTARGGFAPHPQALAAREALAARLRRAG